MKTYLIFGGSGFIGSHLTKTLSVNKNTSITVADIKPPTYSLASNIQYQHCDIRVSISSEFFPRPDVIINLAALCTEPGYAAHEYYDTNTKGADHVLQYCESVSCKELWFTSSMSVYEYGDTRKVESVQPNPSTHYGRSKLAAEKLHLAWLDRHSTNKLLMVRPAVIFGPGERGNFSRLARALKTGYFAYPGRKDAIKASGYVEDLVDSIIFMSERLQRHSLFNFASPEPYTLETICHTMCKIAGYRVPRLVIPSAAMYGAAKAFDLINQLGLKTDIHPMRITKLISSTNIFPATLLEHGYQFKSSLEESLGRWFESRPSGEFI